MRRARLRSASILALAAIPLIFSAASPLLAVPAASAVAAAVVEPAPAAAPSATQVDGFGIRLTDVPAGSKDDPRARIYIVDRVAPGGSTTRGIEVANTTDAAAGVRVYAAGAEIVDGRFVGFPGDTQNDVSSWVSVDALAHPVSAGGVQSSSVTIDVPKDAAPGEHYAIIWAEVRAASDNGVTLVNRVGIRVYLSVGPGAAPAADFTIDSLTASSGTDGKRMVVASITNTGGRALDLGGTLLLSDGPGGLTAGPFDVSTGTTIPLKATELVTIPLDKGLPAGPWKAEISLHSGLLEKVAHATISFPTAGITNDPVTAQAAGVPWMVPAGISVAAVALVSLVISRRRGVVRRRRARRMALRPIA